MIKIISGGQEVRRRNPNRKTQVVMAALLGVAGVTKEEAFRGMGKEMEAAGHSRQREGQV